MRPALKATLRTACYVDFENLIYPCSQKGRHFTVGNAVRSLNRLSREVCGEGFSFTAVYANWDQVSTTLRFAQNDWAQVGWRTVAVPSREDRVSGRVVKNLVDFVMSLDILEDARDREIDHFFIVSGDADFCEVVERLKRLRRRVTVVGLGMSSSYRLREAADETVLWDLEDISGTDSYPLKPHRPPPRGLRVAAPQPGEDELQVLKRAIKEAVMDLGARQVEWERVRDEYYLPMLGRGSREEADLFLRELSAAGFASLRPRRLPGGQIRHDLELHV